MTKEIIKLLKANSIYISKVYLQLRLESHPEFPSLVAVQDTLAELSISCYVCRGTKEELVLEKRAFLAHFDLGGGQIIFYKTVKEAEQKLKDFDKYWKGYVMFVDPTPKYGNTEHDRVLRKERQQNIFAITGLISAILILLWVAGGNGAVGTIGLMISSFAGIYFSWLIMQKEFGIQNSFSDKICSMAKHSRCEAVLFSKGAQITDWITWGDVGIVYFLTSVIYLSFAIVSTNTAAFQWIYILSTVGMVFPVYSLYYQWRVVKQWCMLCIGVLLVLCANAVIGTLLLSSSKLFVIGMTEAGLTFLFLMLIVFAIWQVIKSLYQKNLASITNEIKVMSLKRNPEIFNALLEKKPTNEINLPWNDEPIRFGNANAPWQLVIACNPYCGPCAKAHQAIERIYEKHYDKINISIRFALYNNDENDRKTLAAKEIVRHAMNTPYEVIRHWYQLYDLEAYKKSRPIDEQNVDPVIERFIEWNKKASIKATPTFFVNGKELSELYSWKEFSEILDFELSK